MSEDRHRQRVSVENLLVWAYRQQMVHEARTAPAELVGGGGPLAAYSPLWADGVPIDNSRKMGGDAAPDARRVHALVLGLGRVTVDCGHDLAAARYHRLMEYRGAEPPGVAGNADRTARPWPTDGLARIDMPSLVMLHASRGTRPEWPLRADWRLKPMHNGMVRHPRQKGGVYQRGWYHHVQADGVLPGDVALARQTYGVWWDALRGLLDQLVGMRLTMWSVTEALPPPP
jgi:hypothetical protein